MRIGFDAKRLFNNFTGLGNYSRFIVSSLAAHYPQHEFWLYTPKLRKHPETAAFLNSPPFFVRQPGSVLSSMLPSYWRSFRLGRVAEGDRVAILHGLSNELPARKANVRTVVTVHDLIFKRFPEYYSPIDVRIYSWKLKAACERGDAIVAVSRQTADDLSEFMKVGKERVHVVGQGCHPAFERDYGREALAKVKEKYHLPDEFVLSVGTFERRKNAATLIKAIPMLNPRTTVVLAGKPSKYLEELRNLAAALKVERDIIFIPGIPFAELPLLYRLATVFVYPSIFEGFGIPILEAIASGVPVVTSRGSSFPDTGGPHCAYVNPADPAELAHALTQVMGDEHLRAEMMRGSQEYARRFAPATISAKLMSLYESLV